LLILFLLGELSQGMLLSAEGEKDIWQIVTVSGEIDNGAKISIEIILSINNLLVN